MTEADWRAAWEAALDELEIDVRLAEALLAGDAEETEPRPPWQPPRLPVPMPNDLRDRAAAILERQYKAAGALATAMAGNRRHAALAARMGTDARSERPVFVDSAL